jgi:hypothetical protein
MRGEYWEFDNYCRRTRTLILPDRGMGRGASGVVYKDPGVRGKAIKIYHHGERQKSEEKIRAMVRFACRPLRPDHFSLAWPETIIAAPGGEFAGFRMPFFAAGWKGLDALIQAEAAKADWMTERDRLTVAANLSLAVEELHRSGIRCIDLKPANIRVNTRSWAVAMIDCDGMSVIERDHPGGRRYPAGVCTMDFWAPENFGLDPANFRDEEAQDRFALAVIIFMLLNRGMHAYQGIMAHGAGGDATFADNIKNNRWPFASGQTAVIPRGDSIFPFLPKATQLLFEQAFTRPAARPAAAVWHLHLDQLLGATDICRVEPRYHVRYAESGCPICARDHAQGKRKPAWRPLLARTIATSFSFSREINSRIGYADAGARWLGRRLTAIGDGIQSLHNGVKAERARRAATRSRRIHVAPRPKWGLTPYFILFGVCFAVFKIWAGLDDRHPHFPSSGVPQDLLSRLPLKTLYMDEKGVFREWDYLDKYGLSSGSRSPSVYAKTRPSPADAAPDSGLAVAKEPLAQGQPLDQRPYGTLYLDRTGAVKRWNYQPNFAAPNSKSGVAKPLPKGEMVSDGVLLVPAPDLVYGFGVPRPPERSDVDAPGSKK